MDLTPAFLADLVRATLRSPRTVARRMMAFDVPMHGRWAALALSAVLSAILAHLTFSMMAVTAGPQAGAIPSPITTALMQAVVLVLTVVGVQLIGRRFGGKGQLADAVLLIAWLQFILICVQVLQLAAILILPPLASLLSVVGLGLFLWLLASFVAELHGFTSTGRTLVGILVSLFGIAFVLATVVSVIFGPGAGRI